MRAREQAMMRNHLMRSSRLAWNSGTFFHMTFFRKLKVRFSMEMVELMEAQMDSRMESATVPTA